MDELYTIVTVGNSNLDPNCLFCAIVKGEEPADIVYETDDFLVINNKYPEAPVHMLVLDKQHREKSETLSGVFSNSGYWDRMFATIYEAVKLLELDSTGYKLVNNGAGYNHFEHEHFHITGRYDTVPQT